MTARQTLIMTIAYKIISSGSRWWFWDNNQWSHTIQNLVIEYAAGKEKEYYKSMNGTAWRRFWKDVRQRVEHHPLKGKYNV